MTPLVSSIEDDISFSGLADLDGDDAIALYKKARNKIIALDVAEFSYWGLMFFLYAQVVSCLAYFKEDSFGTFWRNVDIVLSILFVGGAASVPLMAYLGYEMV